MVVQNNRIVNEARGGGEGKKIVKNQPAAMLEQNADSTRMRLTGIVNDDGIMLTIDRRTTCVNIDVYVPYFGPVLPPCFLQRESTLLGTFLPGGGRNMTHPGELDVLRHPEELPMQGNLRMLKNFP